MCAFENYLPQCGMAVEGRRDVDDQVGVLLLQLGNNARQVSCEVDTGREEIGNDNDAMRALGGQLCYRLGKIGMSEFEKRR